MTRGRPGSLAIARRAECLLRSAPSMATSSAPTATSSQSVAATSKPLCPFCRRRHLNKGYCNRCKRYLVLPRSAVKRAICEALLLLGVYPDRISLLIDLSVSTVYEVRARLGLPRQVGSGRKPDLPRLARIAKAYSEGIPINNIQSRFSCSYQTVAKACRLHNIPLRYHPRSPL